MRIRYFFLLLFGVSQIFACADKSHKAPASSTQAGQLPPVESKPPNSSYKPAFSGQTRIAGMRTKTAVAIRLVTDNLDRPWGIAVLPDGRLLITEKAGTMRIATSTGNIGPKIKGIPKVNPSGQGGLLDVVTDPDFTSNRMLYWTFSDKTAAGNLTAVARGRLSDDESAIERSSVIYRATPAYDGNLHYGSRILFDSTGNLIFSTGERSDLETRPQAQWLNSSLGKIIRITTDGNPAPGNPFAGKNNVRPELFTIGHRNVQSLAIHPETGDLWECEFGPLGGDELNLIRAGKNYGWPVITYGLEYSGEKVGAGITQKSGLEQPVYYWDPVVSPSGMTFYSGKMIPEWKNNLFIGGLSSTHIIRLVIKNNKVVGEERLLSDERQRFRDVAEGNDGSLYAITDSGRLYRIFKK